MSSYELVELVITSQFVNNLGGAICIGKMGYRIFAHLTEKRKVAMCNHLTSNGLLVLPHVSPLILNKECILVSLHSLARAFIDANIHNVIFVGYGMKVPISY